MIILAAGLPARISARSSRVRSGQASKGLSAQLQSQHRLLRFDKVAKRDIATHEGAPLVAVIVSLAGRYLNL